MIEMGSGSITAPPSPGRGSRSTVGRILGWTFLWLAFLLLSLWALAALYVDCRIPALRVPAVLVYVAAVIVIMFRVGRWKAACCFGCFCVVLLWWLGLQPSNEGNWRPDDARPAWAEIDGDRVTIHNVRNCDYRSETEFSHCWTDRSYDLSQLRGVDFFFVNWGIPWIGHPIVSFDFGDDRHLAFSVEARYKVGQEYSSLLGFFRQYELIFIAADERDVIRLRTNFRKDEEVYLYRTVVSPAVARKLLLVYLTDLNRLKDHPEWYNALTKNCTTAIDRQIRAELPAAGRWSYRLLLNGTLDELEYERGRLVTGGLPFAELKAREHLNAVARTVGESPEFSKLFRAGRVGF